MKYFNEIMLTAILAISGWTLTKVVENNRVASMHEIRISTLEIDGDSNGDKLEYCSVWIAKIESQIENLKACRCDR